MSTVQEFFGRNSPLIMDAYIEQMEAMDHDKRKAVCEAMLATLNAIAEQLSGYADNHPVIVSDMDEYNNPNNSGFIWSRLMCLKWLAEGAQIIDLKYTEDSKYVLPSSKGEDYLVTVTNRYVFEELLLAIQKIHARLTNYDGYGQAIENESVPNLAYYDLESGRGLVNGNAVNLRGRNRKLFNALFLTAPNPIDRALLIGIAKFGHKDDDNKQALHDAFSAVRKACKVDSTVISVRGESCKLNARVFPLSFQLFQNTYGTTKIRPKSPPK